ncbi:MAG: hypothetical protein V7K97_18465 [Nostoc sp.]|uniref:hypothetical protein n=1 Tax=Nostoc sp. TaxID=1180 RepID=UPI002FF67C19
MPTILLKRLGVLFFAYLQTTLAKIRLFEEWGETSRFINAELGEKGDLIIIEQDGGKAAMPRLVNYAYWGDEDDEFKEDLDFRCL